MKYTKQEQLNEILIRGKNLRQRKDRQALQGLSATVVALFAVLATCIGSFGGKAVLESRTDYGSFLLSAEVGGYILVAVVAFVAGVIVAVVLQMRRSKREEGCLDDAADARKKI